MKLLPCILYGRKPYIYSSTETTLLGKRLPEHSWWRRWMAVCGEDCTVWSGSREGVKREWNERQEALRIEKSEREEAERKERERGFWSRLWKAFETVFPPRSTLTRPVPPPPPMMLSTRTRLKRRK